MKQTKQKLYCFVDETGQDTGGDMFLVSVVLKDGESVNALRHSMEEIEHASGKYRRKWTKTPNPIKQRYLSLLLQEKLLRETVFYSVYHDSKDYTPLMALTIAKSIKSLAEKDYSATIVIDGLQDADTESVRRQLKSLKIRYTRIRGMKDEQDPLLRLADSMSGFVRDHLEGQSYAQKIFTEFSKRQMIREI